MSPSELNDIPETAPVASTKKQQSFGLWSSWAGLLRALLFLGAVAVVAHFLLQAYRPDQLELGNYPSGTTLSFGKDGRLVSYMVHPRDYQDTGIKVKQGERLTIDAVGSVNIGLTNLIKVWQQHEATASSTVSMNKSPATAYYPWFGPEGIDVRHVVNDSIRRNLDMWQNANLHRSANPGQLLAIIAPPDSIPIIGAPRPCKYQCFPVSPTDRVFQAPIDGNLYFVINDAWNKDPVRTQLWWLDNMGFFSVTIRID